jgi:hypothetical protein
MEAKKNQNIINPLENWSNIHIFGYGETQIIGNPNLNKKFQTSNLTKVQEAIDFIFSLRPESANSIAEYHIINIFKDYKLTFVPSDFSLEPWDIDYENMDTTTIDALAGELILNEEIL